MNHRFQETTVDENLGAKLVYNPAVSGMNTRKMMSNLTTRVARAMIDSCVDESLRVKPNKGLGITKGTIKMARYQIAGLCPMMEGVDGEGFFFEDLYQMAWGIPSGTLFPELAELWAEIDDDPKRATNIRKAYSVIGKWRKDCEESNLGL